MLKLHLPQQKMEMDALSIFRRSDSCSFKYKHAHLQRVTKIDNDSNATYRTATYIKLYHTLKCRALSCFSWKLWSSAVAVHYNCKAAIFPDTNFTVSIFGIKVLACSVHHVHSSRICTETRLRTEERCLLKRSSSDLIGYWNHRVQL